MNDKILIINNKDSFVMNLNQIVEEIGFETVVVDYDELTLSLVSDYKLLIISPGPGHPMDYIKYFEIFNEFLNTKSFLGVCLGMQIIGLYFGAKIKKCKNIIHGRSSKNLITNPNFLYLGVPNQSSIGRYHSWCLDEQNFPENLVINSISEDGVIMSISHYKFPFYGVQFHPESYITEFGDKIIQNWIYHTKNPKNYLNFSFPL